MSLLYFCICFCKLLKCRLLITISFFLKIVDHNITQALEVIGSSHWTKEERKPARGARKEDSSSACVIWDECCRRILMRRRKVCTVSAASQQRRRQLAARRRRERAGWTARMPCCSNPLLPAANLPIKYLPCNSNYT